MKGWFSTTCRAFILTALLCYIIGMFGNKEISTNGYITGFFVSLLIILLVLTKSFTNMFQENNGTSFSISSMLFNAFTFTGPLILSLVITSLVLYKTFKYRTNIINDNVGEDYVWYSEFIVLLMILQMIVVYFIVSDDKFDTITIMSNLNSSILYLLGVSSMIGYISLNSILTDYTTDGFLGSSR